MTNREFFTAITANTAIPADIRDYAANAIAKLDERNTKRKNTMSKEQIANEAIKSNIVAMLDSHPKTAMRIASALSLSTQKVSALCRQLVADGVVNVGQFKPNDKGAKVNGYTLAEPLDEAPSDEESAD